MYTGQHHLRLMRSAEAIRRETRHSLDLHILSAGYGLISGAHAVAPYDCTFAGMGKAELRDWAAHLSIPAVARRMLSHPFDLGLVLLSNEYLAACQLPPDLSPGGATLFFSSASAAKALWRLSEARVVPLGNTEASRFSCPLVSLKGELGGRILSLLVQTNTAQETDELKDRLFDPSVNIYSMLDTFSAIRS